MKTLNWLLISLLIFTVFSPTYADTSFLPRFAGQQAVEGTNSLAVTFSQPIDATQDLNTYADVFTGDGTAVEGGWVAAKDPRVIYFANVEPDTEYIINIHKGLKSGSGIALKNAKKFTVRTRPVVPMIGFSSKGFILPSRLSRGLPVNTLNIKKADIDFFRVKPKFTADFSSHFTRHNQMYYYMNKRLHNYTDLVYSGRWDLEIKKDIRTQVNIPITHIKELSVPGIYFAVIKGAGRYEYNFSATWFTISDLGLHAKHYKNRLQLHAQSLETAEPLFGALIEGYTPKGERIFNIKTDGNGTAAVDLSSENLNHITAKFKDSITFLPLNVPVLDLSEFRTAIEPFRPIDLFVYGPRDLYRPGETVVIDGLLRNKDGRMTAALPLSAAIIRPDGRMVHEFLWKGKNLNHYHYEYNLSSNAITGKWRMTFKHGADTLKEYPFHVADFLPERMKLTLSNPNGQTDILNHTDRPAIKLKGDFLYGAPAAGVRSDAIIHLRPARELFKGLLPRFEFGDIKENFKQTFDTGSIVLNQKGEGRITLKNQWQDARSPLWLTANISIYDSGGRPVTRNRSWQIWPSNTLVGIRLMAEDGKVKQDSTAQFEVVVTNRQGKKLKADNLKAVVIKEHREYYWEYRNDTWQWEHTSHFYPVDRFSVNVPENGSAKVQVPVEWGGYRLEITNPATKLVSSFRIQAGWHTGGITLKQGANRPDRVVLSLDKPAYREGDTARIQIKTPGGGTGYIFVESDTNLKTVPVKVPLKGTVVDIDIDPTWARHDLYISALIVRKADKGKALLPKRSVGLIHLPLDRSQRKLSLTSDLPKKIEPNQPFPVDIRVTNPDGTKTSNAYVTLALVDVGILNLTGFTLPSPHDYFFQDRKYDVRMHDIYQKLIEANKGAWAKQRFGGDAPALSRGGDRPSTDVRIISITNKAVLTGPDGTASFDLPIPDFNGTLRLMAVAHTGYTYGSLGQEIIVAAPVVTQITMPRFLAMGDKSRVALDVHNLTDTSQSMAVSLGVEGPISLISEGKKEISLKADEKTTLLFELFARQQMGRSTLEFTLDNVQTDGSSKTLRRSWFLDTRPAYPAWTKIERPILKPGQSFTVAPVKMNHLIKETIGVQATISSMPPINIADHIQQLDAYPYGCLEQTVSGIFPHVIISRSDMAELGIQGQSADVTAKKVRLGIRRLIEKQKPRGGFGLWSAHDDENYWLTAYAADFLLHARQAGFTVPPTALKKALERLKTYIRRPGSVRPKYYMAQKQYKAATRAYAAFVLARVHSVSLGDTRGLYRSLKKDLKTGLGMAHMGLALYLTGDQNQAESLLSSALSGTTPKTDRPYAGNYGSALRDAAASFFLVSSFFPEYPDRARFIASLQEKLTEKLWFNTQERNALVLAGSIAVKDKGKRWQADVATGGTQQPFSGDRPKQVTRIKGESANGFSVTNTGQTDLYLSTVISGYPAQQPKPESNGIHISRRYLTSGGSPMPEGPVKSGTRMIVELSFRADKRLVNGLLVDFLPACLEPEDPSLAGSMDIDSLKVDKKTIHGWHSLVSTRNTEYRDDRFVAALDIPGKTSLRYFYPVRVVSPGDFLVPPPLAEDMYQPEIRAFGDTKPLLQVVQP